MSMTCQTLQLELRWQCLLTIQSATNANESPDDFDTVQTYLNHLQRWSLANEMTFQPKKFENLRVSRKRTSPRRSYSIDAPVLK